MTTDKNKVELLLENRYLVGEINFWWGRDKTLVRRKSNGAEFFLVEGMRQI